MPVDNTKIISPRRTTKKLTEEEIKDIEQKRLRGEHDYDHLFDLCESYFVCNQASLRALSVDD
jgi:hypothetical protein